MWDLLFLLCAGHAVADYPLQGDFLARGKNRATAFPGMPWWIILTMHALIHAGTVYVITRSLHIALLELVLHWLIDEGKNRGLFNFTVDQMCHVFCKLIFVYLLVF